MKFVTQHKEENIEDEQTTNSYLNPQQFTLQTNYFSRPRA